MCVPQWFSPRRGRGPGNALGYAPRFSPAQARSLTMRAFDADPRFPPGRYTYPAEKVLEKRAANCSSAARRASSAFDVPADWAPADRLSFE